MRIPIFQSMIMNFANTMIRGNALEEQFKHKEVRRHWYYHWLGRCNHLKTGNIRPLEITRAKWATAKNALDHYNLLENMMVELGLAVRNTAFVEGEELSEPIKITKPGRIFSMDETRLTNDATTCSKAKANRSVIGKDGDCGEVIVNKGGGNGTGIGDTSADGLDLPGFFIFANNIIHAGENDEDVAAHNCPSCRWPEAPDPNDASKPMPCRFWTNAKGGVTVDFGVRYIQGCVEPCLPDLSPENPALLIMDGHGSHFTLKLLHYCRARGLRAAYSVAPAAHNPRVAGRGCPVLHHLQAAVPASEVRAHAGAALPWQEPPPDSGRPAPLCKGGMADSLQSRTASRPGMKSGCPRSPGACIGT